MKRIVLISIVLLSLVMITCESRREIMMNNARLDEQYSQWLRSCMGDSFEDWHRQNTKYSCHRENPNMNNGYTWECVYFASWYIRYLEFAVDQNGILTGWSWHDCELKR